MFKELEQLNEMIAKADEQADNAIRELQDKYDEKVRLEARYEEMLSNGGNIAEISRVKQTIKNLEGEISILQEMVKVLDKKRFKHKNVTERRNLLKPVRAALQREVDKTNKKLEPVFDELRGQLAKTFQTILKANALYREAEQHYNDLIRTEMKLDSHSVNGLHVTDIRRVIGQYVEEAVMAFYQGKLPEWVEQYTDSNTEPDADPE